MDVFLKIAGMLATFIATLYFPAYGAEEFITITTYYPNIISKDGNENNL